MANEQVVEELLKKSQPERGKRIGILIASVVALAIIIGVLASKFGGHPVQNGVKDLMEGPPARSR